MIIYLDPPCPLDCSIFFVRKPTKKKNSRYVIIMGSLFHLCVYGYVVHYLTISFFRPVSQRTANRHTHTFFFFPSSFWAVSVFPKRSPPLQLCVSFRSLSLYSPVSRSIDRRSRTLAPARADVSLISL